MSSDKKWQDIVIRLDRLTKAKEIAWQETSDDDILQATIGQNVIQIRRHNYSRGPAYVVVIRNSEGKAVDQFDESAVSLPYGTSIEKIFVEASRQATGADLILDEILSDLKDRDDIPF